MEHPFMYRASLPRAERSRREPPGEVRFDTDPAVTPMGTMVRGLGIAVMLAAGAFVLTMLKDPPQSMASDPTAPVAKAADVQVPTGLPAVDCFTTTAACQ
jgi:hypothetical protein